MVKVTLVEPCPTAASPDLADNCAANSKKFGCFSRTQTASQLTDFPDIIFRELSDHCPRAPSGSSMSEAVSGVFLRRGPPQMSLVRARSIPAFVRSFEFGQRRGAVRQFADQPMHRSIPPVAPYDAIAFDLCIRPVDTLIGFVGKKRLHNVLHQMRALVRRAGVAIFSPALIVVRAPASRVKRLVTFWNRAYRFGSHSTVLTSFRLEPSQSLPTTGRLAYFYHKNRSVAKQTLFAGAAAGAIALAGCQSAPKGSFCQISSPIRLSSQTVDHLSDEEVSALLAHNEKHQRLCGAKP